MAKEQRKKPRRDVDLPGFLYTPDGWPVGCCTLQDVSETGARLEVQGDHELPSRLILCLSRSTQVRRYCEVVWTTGREAGIRFCAEGFASKARAKR